jgi:uncharacterized protein (TIGR02246 family)
MLRIALLAASLMLYASAGMAQSKATIEKLNEAWTAAFNKGDAAALAAMYADDAQVLPPDGEAVKGRKAIEEFWRKAAEGMGDAKLTTLEVHTMGEIMAYEIGAVTVKTKGATPQEVAGKYVVVWKRSGTSWKLAVDIWNLNK